MLLLHQIVKMPASNINEAREWVVWDQTLSGCRCTEYMDAILLQTGVHLCVKLVSTLSTLLIAKPVRTFVRSGRTLYEWPISSPDIPVPPSLGSMLILALLWIVL